MKKYFFLLFQFILVSIICSAQSNTASGLGLIGYYDISNWTMVPGSGNINTSYAPEYITFSSGDNGYSDFTYMEIVAPIDGVVRFEWNYSTIDIGEPSNGTPGATFDFPFYIINGLPYQFSTYDPLGADVQSGVETFTVSQGQTLGFGAYTVDGIMGSCTIDAFSFSFPPVPINMYSLLAIFGLIALGIIFKRRRIFKRV